MIGSAVLLLTVIVCLLVCSTMLASTETFLHIQTRREAQPQADTELAPNRRRRGSQRRSSQLSPPPPPPSRSPVAVRASADAISSWSSRQSTCGGHGVFNPLLDECRCTAGWSGRRCEERQKRACNSAGGPADNRERVRTDAVCAGNCDEDRGLCYCAGLATPFQRPISHSCAPMAHIDSRLPDGRPAYPADALPTGRAAAERRAQQRRAAERLIAARSEFRARGRGTGGRRRLDCAKQPGSPGCLALLRRESEEVADAGGWGRIMIWERPTADQPYLSNWTRPWGVPLDVLYGARGEYGARGMPAEAAAMRRGWAWPNATGRLGWCEVANEAALSRLLKNGSGLAANCEACYDGRTGPLCETPKRAFCLRDCSGHGTCDLGFCWCEDGWFGIDCSQHRTLPPPPPLSQQQGAESAAGASDLRVYIYDMPSEFTTRNLQWRNQGSYGMYRSYDADNRSRFTSGSLYAMELALHEWLLDSKLRTRDPAKASLFFVPVYLSSLFLWPVVKFADEPYYGRATHETKRRSHQGTLLMREAVRYVQSSYPHWNASGGRDHIFMMLHDEGPCFCPREARNAILLTHYGYYAAVPKPWGTFFDDNFLANPEFYAKWIGDPAKPSPCFVRDKDLVIPPWKTPGFWLKAMQEPKARRLGRRPGIVFFAGELGFRRLKGYSRDLRQRAHALFCHPRERAPCTKYVDGCRTDLPQNCSLWREGVTIATHSARYHDELLRHTFCLAFPGDGWSSRVLDGIIHGCVPVIVEDESSMFFEGAFALVGLGIDFPDFSVRLPEARLHELVDVLLAIPEPEVRRLQANALLVRDYFIYKDMYPGLYNTPHAKPQHARADLLAAGRPGEDAFLLLALALEVRARAIGTLSRGGDWQARNRLLLLGRTGATTVNAST